MLRPQDAGAAGDQAADREFLFHRKSTAISLVLSQLTRQLGTGILNILHSFSTSAFSFSGEAVFTWLFT